MPTYAIDFETFYNNEVSVKPLGAHGYFDSLSLEQIYLVSVVSEDERTLACSPKDLDWSFMENATILVWNGGFEMQGLRRLRDLGLTIPEPAELIDVADMACYVGLPRALKQAAFVALGITVDKGIRDEDMKNKEWLDMHYELRDRVLEYATNDSLYTMQIWKKYSPQWPSEERLVSRLSREWAAEGIGASLEEMEKAKGVLKQVIWEAGNKIPWFNPDDKKSVPLSPKALAIKCREVGIPCPSSLSMDDEGCALWEETYGEQYPWVGAMRDYRRANAILKKVSAMERRTFNNRLCFEVKYFGAGMTGRWSGSAGINMQNISGKVLYGVKARDMIVAPEGKTFIVSDLAQIEPRVLLWLARDADQLNLISSGTSPYVAHAIATMGHNPSEAIDKKGKLYKLAKFRCLALNYGCGHIKFLEMAKIMSMLDLFDEPATEERVEYYIGYLAQVKSAEWTANYADSDDTTKNRLVNSLAIVQDFRHKSPKIVGLWNKFKDALHTSASTGEDLVVNLPSGRDITYKNCRFRRVTKEKKVSQEVVADINRTGRVETSRLYGGLAVENLTQAVARDVFRDCLIRLHEHGYKVALHVHDEAVVEVPLEEAEYHREHIEALMSVSPSWAKGLPVAAEATIAKIYSDGK